MNSITTYSKISKEIFDRRIQESDKLFLIEFGSAWYGSCQIMEPIINDLITLYSEVLEVIRMDIEQNQQLAQKYGIAILPSYIFIMYGEVVDYLFRSAPKTVFENKIKSILSIKTKINV
jgi:thioredoxin 1